MMKLISTQMDTPIGTVWVAVSDKGLCALDLGYSQVQRERSLARRFGAVRFIERAQAGEVVSRLRAYFRGDLDALSDIRVDLGGTPFQRKVWSELRRIPIGSTLSYGELARRIGNPKASRPVGAANGSNPVALVVPCHRVIGSDGTLTGYAFGLEKKRWLLAHEGALQADNEPGFDFASATG